MSRRSREAPAGRVLTGHIFRVRNGHGYAFSDGPPPAAPEPVRRPARVAQMLGLAHRIEEAIERGDYRDRADAARQLGITRARVTQLLDLLLLAPDIQEHIVFLEAVDGVEPLSERALRDELDACLEAGMDDLLTKPYRLQDLAAVLARRLGSG